MSADMVPRYTTESLRAEANGLPEQSINTVVPPTHDVKGRLVDLFEEDETRNLIGIEYLVGTGFRVRQAGFKDGGQEILYEGDVLGVHLLMWRHGQYDEPPWPGALKWERREDLLHCEEDVTTVPAEIFLVIENKGPISTGDIWAEIAKRLPLDAVREICTTLQENGRVERVLKGGKRGQYLWKTTQPHLI